MVRANLKGVNSVKKKLKDGSTARYTTIVRPDAVLPAAQGPPNSCGTIQRQRPPSSVSARAR